MWLEEVLTKRKIKAGKDVMSKLLSAAKASDVQDALCKAVYSALFNHLVAQINGALSESSRGKAASRLEAAALRQGLLQVGRKGSGVRKVEE